MEFYFGPRHMGNYHWFNHWCWVHYLPVVPVILPNNDQCYILWMVVYLNLYNNDARVLMDRICHSFVHSLRTFQYFGHTFPQLWSSSTVFMTRMTTLVLNSRKGKNYYPSGFSHALYLIQLLSFDCVIFLNFHQTCCRCKKNPYFLPICSRP